MFAFRSVAVRSGAIVNLRNYSKIKTDPGVHKRSKILQSPEDLDEMDVDEMEPDFMDVHKSHKEHMRELEMEKEKLKYLIVKRKYFNRKFPNFLTWQDKEQIKHLHSTDPQEWTIERLSESFPALPEVILKVVKAKYTKKESSIATHDLTVQRNWQMFEKGEMSDIPDSLSEHLKKFTSRSTILKPFVPKDNKKMVVNLCDRLPKGEFSEIISSYERIKKKDEPQETKTEVLMEPKNIKKDRHNEDSYFTGRIIDKTMITLSNLEENIKYNASKGKKLAEDDKLLLLNTQKESASSKLMPISLEGIDIAKITQNKHETHSGAVMKSVQDYSHLIYPEKIVIPKDKMKKGATYKLNDCYYDSDGTFLYRVPGMC